MSDLLYYFYFLKVNINTGENNSLQEFMANLNPEQQEILQSHFSYTPQTLAIHLARVTYWCVKFFQESYCQKSEVV